MKKKVVIILIVAAVVIAVGVVAGVFIKKHLDEKTRTMDEFVTTDVGKVKSMSIMDGSNGQVVEVPSKHYEEILKMLSEISMPGVFKNEEGLVYPTQYRLNITDDKGETIIIFYSVKCNVDGKEYNLTPNANIEAVLKEVYEKSGGVQ